MTMLHWSDNIQNEKKHPLQETGARGHHKATTIRTTVFYVISVFSLTSEYFHLLLQERVFVKNMNTKAETDHIDLKLKVPF